MNMRTTTASSAASVSLADIAEKVGVSRHTVGRVLGDKPHLHADGTVERIRRIADEMGYRPNLLARSVRSGRTMTAGIMLDLQHDSYSCDLLQGMHDGLLSSGYTPLTLVGARDSTEVEQVYRLMDRRVDGLLVRPFSVKMSEDYVHEACERSIPTVIVNSPLDSIGDLDFCGTDDVGGGRKAARHLLDLGHRRILHLTYLHQCTDVLSREEGFRLELEAVAGTSCLTVHGCVSKPTETENALRELLTGPDRYTAVFVAGDGLAEGVYLAAHRIGIRIPEELSVIGFCDLAQARYMIPPLTTMRQDGYGIGKRAAMMLFDRMSGGAKDGEAVSVRLRTEMIVRESTAPPSGS